MLAQVTCGPQPSMAVALIPTPTDTPSQQRRLAGFATILEALDHAANGSAGLNFHDGRGVLRSVLTYVQLRERAREAAGRMLSEGIQPGDRIAIPARTDADFVVGFFGAMYAGAVPVPLALPAAFGQAEAYAEQLRRQLQAARPTLLLASSAWIQAVAGTAEVLDGPWRIVALAELAARNGTVPPMPRPDDLAYLQFSSGSTRMPTGVAISHANLIANCTAINAHGLRIGESDRAVSWLPFFHDMGLVGFLLAPIASQTSVDYLPTDDFARRPLAWLQLIARSKATVSYAPTFAYELCARRLAALPVEDVAALDLSCWRVAGIGGEMVRLPALDRFSAALAPAGFRPEAFCPSYGLAECVLAVSVGPGGLRTASPVGEPAPQYVSCGRVLPGHELDVRDPVSGRTQPAGEPGRMFIRGPSVMRGYFEQADASRRALSNGWLDTGDIGFVADGNLFLVGRAKDMFVVNGRNVWPQDVEWALERAAHHPGAVPIDRQPGPPAARRPRAFRGPRRHRGGRL